MAGKRVLILEKREIVGGACVTEEIIPGRVSGHNSISMCPHSQQHYGLGFAFSRASYLLSLLRPQIAKELKLKVSCGCCTSGELWSYLCHVGLWPTIVPSRHCLVYTAGRQ